MPAQPSAAPANEPRSGAVGERELVLSRVIAAPRELVFDAFTDPAHIDQWWGPEGFRNTTHHIDLRPGGEWRFVMHAPDGTDFPNYVAYREVVRPQRLVFDHGSGPGDDAMFLVTVTFAEHAGQTLLTMRSRFKSRQARDAVLEFGAVKLGQQTLGKFAAFVAARLAAAGGRVMLSTALLLLAGLLCTGAAAAPVVYNIDPDHTYPSFEADHMGISIWRGKFNKSSGKVSLDKAAGRGTVEVSVATDSIDFGHDKLNQWASSAELLDARRYPRASFKGQLEGFAGGAPAHAVGELTLHGVTRPLTLTIHSFKCVAHPLFKRDLCGADLSGSLNREEFGLSAGKDWGFKMDVTLRIQVEAVAAE